MKKIVICLLILYSGVILGQQESTIGFYQNHLNVVNPAYNSVDGETNFKAGIRTQWTGVENAPETQIVSFMTPLNDRIALGFSIVNDRVFIEKQTFIGLDFSYKVQLDLNHTLYMGIKAGGNNYSIDTNALNSFNVVADASLEGISRFNPNVGVGFYLEHEDYFVSLSTPRILNTERAKNEDGFATVATDRVHYYISSGYFFKVNTDFTIVPTFMLRYVDGAPTSVDLTTKAVYKDQFQVGLNYRTDNTLGALAQLAIFKNVAVGYLYEYNLSSNLSGRVQGSHEFYLQLGF